MSKGEVVASITAGGILVGALAAFFIVGDRYSQGARVILVDDRDTQVWVSDTPNHRSTDPDSAAFYDLGGKNTSEHVPTGTRATVVQDAEEISGARKIKIVLCDPPYAGLTGTVTRNHIKGE